MFNNKKIFYFDHDCNLCFWYNIETYYLIKVLMQKWKLNSSICCNYSCKINMMSRVAGVSDSPKKKIFWIVFCPTPHYPYQRDCIYKRGMSGQYILISNKRFILLYFVCFWMLIKILSHTLLIFQQVKKNSRIQVLYQTTYYCKPHLTEKIIVF